MDSTKIKGTKMTELVSILDLEFPAIIDSWSAFDPGVSSGPAENCYPAEGGEVEWHVDTDFPGAEFIQAVMDRNEDWYQQITEKLYEGLSEEPDEREPPEPAYDQWYN